MTNAAALAGVVRGGVAECHQQEGHYPWRGDCAVCCEAALRNAPHLRRLPHAGVLAVDLAALGNSGPRVLVGATQRPGWTYAEPVRGKSADQLRAPLLRMVQDAMQRGTVTTLHADREAGIESLETELLALGVRLSLTQGRDPQANGLAEQAVGALSRMARAALAHLTSPDVKVALWPFAMVWAAQRLADPKLPPFGALAQARLPTKAMLGKLDRRTNACVILHKSTKVSGALRVGVMADGSVLRAVADRRTIRADVTECGKWKFPDMSRVEARTAHAQPGAGLQGRPCRMPDSPSD